MKVRELMPTALILLSTFGSAKSQNQATSVRPGLAIYAAGSLRLPIEQIAGEYQKRTGIPVQPTFGPSGVLRERIEHGERPDVLASADMASPRKLAAEGLGSPVRTFTANAVCVVTRPGLDVNSSTLLNVMLEPNVRTGAGTPVADPLGDCAESAVRAEPKLRLVHLPANLSVAATFGYTIIAGAKPEAADFGHFLESNDAQEIFQKNGFVKK